MVRMTLEVPEDLAERIRPMGSWLPTILELSLVGFQTVAAAVATEVVRFLSGEPTPRDVVGFHASEHSQARLQRLLALNESGLLGKEEHRELDELQKIEHILVMLKTQAATRLRHSG